MTYTPRFGATPGSFTAATGTPLVESLNADWERITIPDTAGSGSPRRFGRVTVSLAAP